MSAIRILAIEDDAIAAASLRVTLDELDYVLIEVVDDVAEFKRLVKATIPDILLIDIDLGAQIDGIELASELTDHYNVPFIFVTSFRDKETIIRATETLPAAYITKPYEVAALQAAVELAIRKKQSNPQKTSESTQHEAFFIKEEGTLKKVHPQQILYIEANNKTCILRLENTEKVMSVQLRELMAQLPEGQFSQVHRSFIINLERVEEIDPNYHFVMVEAHKVPVGRSYKESLMRQLHRLG